jgi:hypothetical protein
LAGFAIGAEVCVIADGVVRFDWIGAYACGCVAYADLMAVIQGRTNDRVAGLAGGVFTVVFHSAAIGVITGGPIRLRRIVANPSFWDAYTHVMALAECFADHGIRAYTSPVQATIIGSAEIVIIAAGSINLITKVTFAGLSITEGSNLALIGLWAFHIGDRCTDSSGTFFSE